MRDLGVSSQTCNLLSSYLSERSQLMNYFGSFSGDLAIKLGVLQGNVIGPLLFNIFINNLLKQLSADNVIAYTDDLTLACSGDALTSVYLKVKNLLLDVQDWSNRHRLKINASKCFAMAVTSRKRTAQLDNLFINSCEIKQVSEIKILGVIFASDLTFTSHMTQQRSSLICQVSFSDSAHR